ncbi:MAG: transaldolase [bacterium]|nr:transaldolase [bacterium]MDE0668466.1 transaldolase [bacterium]MXZ29353.1 transaldolase [Acidimicrobiia bacterium]MYJ14771.1 transaldolase [Acidimicrobiia bacterium]
MTRLVELHEVGRQSPWLDNLKRSWITDGELRRWVERGCRGITSNPTIFQRAMTAGDAYDGDLAELAAGGASAEESYWHLVTSDILAALAVLRPTYDASGGTDGYVSVEVAPELAHDAAATAAAARELHRRIGAPNLYVKVPATAAGVDALATLTAEGHSINVTLIFSLARYEQVIEAYLSGLESRRGDLSCVSGVASFFVSRVDTEVDRRLDAIGTPAARALRGRAAVAQAKLAYATFRRCFSGPRWAALAARGARLQRPLWASTSTKNPAYPDTLYVDSLIGPDTVNTLPEATIEAFEDHGTVARTIDAEVDDAAAVLNGLAQAGVDLAEVSEVLEAEGVAAFAKSFDELLETLARRAAELTA